MKTSAIRAILKELFAQERSARASDNSSMRDEGAACIEARQFLHAYIDAELDGKDAAAQFPAVEAALQASGELLQEYEALRDLLLAERQGNLVEPPATAAFDLSYLASVPTAEAPAPRERQAWHLNQLGQLVIQFSEELLQTLQPPMQLSGVKSGEKGMGEVFFTYTLQGGLEDVEVEIAARDARDEPQLCNVALFVDVPSRGGWPNLAGSEITLRSESGIVKKQTTDAFGRALFRGVAKAELPRLSLEISPVGWQPQS